MEGSMKNSISEEVLLKLDNRTTAALVLDCGQHGARGRCSGEKEPAQRRAEKPNPDSYSQKAKCPTTHVFRLHSHGNLEWCKGKGFRNHNKWSSLCKQSQIPAYYPVISDQIYQYWDWTKKSELLQENELLQLLGQSVITNLD